MPGTKERHSVPQLSALQLPAKVFGGGGGGGGGGREPRPEWLTMVMVSLFGVL